MRSYLLLGTSLIGFTGVTMAQGVTIDVPGGYEVVVVPDSVSVAIVLQTVYVAPTPVPAYRPHPYVHHLASIDEGTAIEYQIDDHHH